MHIRKGIEVFLHSMLNLGSNEVSESLPEMSMGRSLQIFFFKTEFWINSN